MTKETLSCVICGKDTYRPTKKTCSKECRTEHLRLYHRDYSARHRKKTSRLSLSEIREVLFGENLTDTQKIEKLKGALLK